MLFSYDRAERAGLAWAHQRRRAFPAARISAASGRTSRIESLVPSSGRAIAGTQTARISQRQASGWAGFGEGFWKRDATWPDDNLETDVSTSNLDDSDRLLVPQGSPCSQVGEEGHHVDRRRQGVARSRGQGNLENVGMSKEAPTPGRPNLE